MKDCLHCLYNLKGTDACLSCHNKSNFVYQWTDEPKEPVDEKRQSGFEVMLEAESKVDKGERVENILWDLTDDGCTYLNTKATIKNAEHRIRSIIAREIVEEIRKDLDCGGCIHENNLLNKIIGGGR